MCTWVLARAPPPPHGGGPAGHLLQPVPRDVRLLDGRRGTIRMWYRLIFKEVTWKTGLPTPEASHVPKRWVVDRTPGIAFAKIK